MTRGLLPMSAATKWPPDATGRGRERGRWCGSVVASPNYNTPGSVSLRRRGSGFHPVASEMRGYDQPYRLEAIDQ
jgi:hypothetical protein